MAGPSPMEILRKLVEVIDREERERPARLEREARERLADLRRRFEAEYRELEAEVRCRYGKAPSVPREAYVERRLCEVLGVR